MTCKELIKKLQSRTTEVDMFELASIAADKIERLQKLVDDMTNDHYVDTLDFYFERCQKLEEDFSELVMSSENICHYCSNKIECKGKDCPKYIEGSGCWDDRRGYYDWCWSCKDFNFGTCDMLEDTPCNGCLSNNNKGFNWRGNNV